MWVTPETWPGIPSHTVLALTLDLPSSDILGNLISLNLHLPNGEWV